MSQEHSLEHKNYLERTKVLSAVQDALQLLVEKRPDDPLLFLSEHFDKLTHPSADPVQRTVSLLQNYSVDDGDPTDIIYESFTLLTKGESWSHIEDGIIGITFNGFLRRLFSDIEKGGELLKTLVQPDDERVEFKTFSSIIRTYFKSKQMQQL